MDFRSILPWTVLLGLILSLIAACAPLTGLFLLQSPGALSPAASESPAVSESPTPSATPETLPADAQAGGQS